MTIVNQWIEEDYFTSICSTLLLIGEMPEDQVEKYADHLMDAHTHNGILDTESIDTVMAEWT